jgi:hypothetical protein
MTGRARRSRSRSAADAPDRRRGRRRGSALASIGDVLLTILVSVFSVAVRSTVVSWMERRLGWSGRLCATALVVVIVVGLGGATWPSP